MVNIYEIAFDGARGQAKASPEWGKAGEKWDAEGCDPAGFYTDQLVEMGLTREAAWSAIDSAEWREGWANGWKSGIMSHRASRPHHWRESWWRLTGWNQEELIGYTTWPVVREALEWFNRNREVNLYAATRVSDRDAKKLGYANRNDLFADTDTQPGEYAAMLHPASESENESDGMTADEVKRAKALLGLTNQGLAELLGVSKPTVDRALSRGLRGPGAKFLRQEIKRIG